MRPCGGEDERGDGEREVRLTDRRTHVAAGYHRHGHGLRILMAGGTVMSLDGEKVDYPEKSLWKGNDALGRAECGVRNRMHERVVDSGR